MTILGVASGAIDSEYDRWVFFARSEGVPAGFGVAFQTASGRKEMRVEPEASLRHRQNLVGVPWFVLPVVGPPRAEVTAIDIAGQRIALPKTP